MDLAPWALNLPGLWQAWRMDFSLTARQAAFRQKVQEFAANELEPAAGAQDRNGRFPLGLVDELARLGLMGTFVPEEHGGPGEDYVSYVAALEELSKAWASLGAIVSVQNSMVCYPILRFGDEPQSAVQDFADDHVGRG